MVARSKPASLHPADTRRLLASEERVRRRMCDVDESLSRAAAFAADVDRAGGGMVLEQVDDEDSLVIHIESVARSLA